MVLVLAAGVLFGAHVPAHPLVVALLVGVVAAGAAVLAVRTIAPVWRRRPQIVTWSALAIVPATCAFTFAFAAPAIAPRVPAEIAAIAVAYLGVCVMAGTDPARRAHRAPGRNADDSTEHRPAARPFASPCDHLLA